MALRGLILGALLLATAASGDDLKVGEAASAVRLYNDVLEPVATVPAGPAWKDKPILAATHPQSTQFVKIRYDGKAPNVAAPAGDYWVRRSSVLPRSSCTMTVVAASERDTRAGPNGAGSFCAASPRP